MTNAEAAILSLVMEGVNYGYEIEKIVDQRGFREWTEIGFSSIYFILNKLERKKYLTSNLVRQDGKGPVRKTYSVTQDGTRALIIHVRWALATPGNTGTNLLQGLANLPLLESDEVSSALTSYLNHLKQRKERIEQEMDFQKGIPEFVTAMFDYSLHMIASEMEWVKNFLTKWSQK